MMWFAPTWILAKREMVRFFRQRSRVMGALLTPVLFWLFLGYGFGDSFRSETHQGGYQAYFFPGVLLMVLMFTSIFSMVSLIEDRQEGFLQYVLISSCPRSSIVIGKVLGTSGIATIQALLVSFLGTFVGYDLGLWTILKVAVACALVSMNMSLFGFLLAWKARSIQGFHVLMNLVLMPMWLLSGAAFPMEGAKGWIVWIMKVNPLTYGQRLLDGALTVWNPNAAAWVVAANAIFFAACLVWVRERRRTML